MNAKTRNGALTEKLTPQQSDLAIQLLANHTQEEVATIISAPEPDGWGIPTSRAAVGRFAREFSEEIGKVQMDSLIPCSLP